MGREGCVKIPFEQYEEITGGSGDIVDWLKRDDVKEALLMDEDASPNLVQVVTDQYGVDLTEDEIEQIGRDPFLISYGHAAAERTIVTFEVSKPSKRRANRKIPDVCKDLRIPCCTLYDMMRSLGFRMDWRPSS